MCSYRCVVTAVWLLTAGADDVLNAVTYVLIPGADDTTTDMYVLIPGADR